MDMGSDLMNTSQEPSRRAYMLRKFILKLQESFLVIEKCPQPVIAAVHSGCVGGGVDMVCNCDIRLCSADAWFQVKVCLSWLSSFALSWLNVELGYSSFWDAPDLGLAFFNAETLSLS